MELKPSAAPSVLLMLVLACAQAGVAITDHGQCDRSVLLQWQEGDMQGFN